VLGREPIAFGDLGVAGLAAVQGAALDEQLGALEVTGCDANVVLSALVIELGKTPIDQSQL